MKNIFKLFCGKDKGTNASDRYFKQKIENINYFLGLRVTNDCDTPYIPINRVCEAEKEMKAMRKKYFVLYIEEEFAKMLDITRNRFYFLDEDGNISKYPSNIISILDCHGECVFKIDYNDETKSVIYSRDKILTPFDNKVSIDMMREESGLDYDDFIDILKTVIKEKLDLTCVVLSDKEMEYSKLISGLSEDFFSKVANEIKQIIKNCERGY